MPSLSSLWLTTPSQTCSPFNSAGLSSHFHTQTGKVESREVMLFLSFFLFHRPIVQRPPSSVPAQSPSHRTTDRQTGRPTDRLIRQSTTFTHIELAYSKSWEGCHLSAHLIPLLRLRSAAQPITKKKVVDASVLNPINVVAFSSGMWVSSWWPMDRIRVTCTAFSSSPDDDDPCQVGICESGIIFFRMFRLLAPSVGGRWVVFAG